MPLGVKLIALLCSFGAVLALWASFMLRNAQSVPLSRAEISLSAMMAALLFITSAGLWMLRRWAAYAYLAHFCLNVVFLRLQGLLPHSVPAVCGIFLQALLILYLLSWPRARAALH